MTAIEPTTITKEQKDWLDNIEAMPRSERRKLGKKLHVKIPGSNKPFVRA